MIETFTLYILISVWMFLTFIQGHSCMKSNKNSVSTFLENYLLIWMKSSVLSQPVGLLKFMLNLFCTNDIHGRELCWGDFMKCVFNILLCRHTCELIYFKLSLMLDTSKLYNLIPFWMTLMFTQVNRVRGKLKLVQSFCCKVSWSSSNVWLIM